MPRARIELATRPYFANKLMIGVKLIGLKNDKRKRNPGLALIAAFEQLRPVEHLLRQ